MTSPVPLATLLQQTIQADWVFVQVHIARSGKGFSLRHVEDKDVAPDQLRAVPLPDLRGLAQSTGLGTFRPLKAAPNLQRGWHVRAASVDQLIEALDHLYPGGLADWRAGQTNPPPVTSYREFTSRQTGMYRITTFLDDTQAALMTRACCDRRFCLRQRRWTVGTLEPDAPESKSILPCLEPCAVLLEFARKITRLEQDESTPAEIAAGDEAAWRAQLNAYAENGLGAKEREADFANPNNPRLVQWKLLKLDAARWPRTAP